ncbi:MAG: tRNA-dihydrouridine synthase family protein [Candidatus Shapirobacteria bacterium]
MTKWLSGHTQLIGLAPMDGITDCAFRSTQAHIAKPDVMFTEFVSAEGLVRGGVKLYDLLLFRNGHRPIIGQLFGKDPDSFYKATVVLCHLGFDGIDLNFGCPAKTVIHHGGGAALIGTPELALSLARASQQAIADWLSGKVSLDNLDLNQKTKDVIVRNLQFSGPPSNAIHPTFSIKTRLGIEENVFTTWIPQLLALKPDFLTLHGRTLKQGYSGQADWDSIAQAANLAHQAGVPLLGNGDISSLSQAREYQSKYSVNGVLIGRFALGNPWVFSNALPTWPDRFNALKFHLTDFQSAFPLRRLDPLRRVMLEYTKSHPHAKALRLKIVAISKLEDFLSLESEFISA